MEDAGLGAEFNNLTFKNMDYKPSVQAANFHISEALTRLLVWGIKGGKTYAGAYEFIRGIKKLEEYDIAWVVSPTHPQTDTCEHELDRILHHPSLGGRIGPGSFCINKNSTKRRYTFYNGSIAYLKTGDVPNNLRGPNVALMWIDELAFLRRESYWIAMDRLAATRKQGKGWMFGTTTPAQRGWFFHVCRMAGLPYAEDYGAFRNKEEDMWLSHYATWDFAWVDQKFIDSKKRELPREIFDREYGAKFSGGGNGVFRYIQEAQSYRPLIKKPEHKFVIGVDLAKFHDFTAATVMNGERRVFDFKRWNKVDWNITKERLMIMANEWNAALAIDSSNVGSVILDDLQRAGVQVYPVNMNSADVKRELIESLQLTFERHNIHIPDPSAEWAPEGIMKMYDELHAYEASITKGGKISFSAPQGYHDDCVISLALANWGANRGLAGGNSMAQDVHVWLDRQGAETKMKMRTPRPRQFRKIFGRERGSGAGPFWR